MFARLGEYAFPMAQPLTWRYQVSLKMKSLLYNECHSRATEAYICGSLNLREHNVEICAIFKKRRKTAKLLPLSIFLSREVMSPEMSVQPFALSPRRWNSSTRWKESLRTVGTRLTRSLRTKSMYLFILSTEDTSKTIGRPLGGGLIKPFFILVCVC